MFRLVLLLTVSVSAPALAADPHETARAAVKRSAALPLERILAAVSAERPGELLDVELVEAGRAYTYRLKIIDPNNRVHDLTIDGATGEIMRSE